PPPSETYTLALHDALPISRDGVRGGAHRAGHWRRAHAPRAHRADEHRAGRRAPAPRRLAPAGGRGGCRRARYHGALDGRPHHVLLEEPEHPLRRAGPDRSGGPDAGWWFHRARGGRDNAMTELWLHRHLWLSVCC